MKLENLPEGERSSYKILAVKYIFSEYKLNIICSEKKIQLVQEGKEVPVTHRATGCSTDTVYTTVLVGHPVTFECACLPQCGLRSDIGHFKTFCCLHSISFTTSECTILIHTKNIPCTFNHHIIILNSKYCNYTFLFFFHEQNLVQ